jgi:hypothetical protein
MILITLGENGFNHHGCWKGYITSAADATLLHIAQDVLTP